MNVTMIFYVARGEDCRSIWDFGLEVLWLYPSSGGTLGHNAESSTNNGRPGYEIFEGSLRISQKTQKSLISVQLKLKNDL